MRFGVTRILVLVAAVGCGCASMADAQALKPAPVEDDDHAIVFELGAAGDWSRSEGFHSGGGVGPELIHVTGPDHGTFWGLSSVLDFMFWPRKNIGWYVEPGYELTVRDKTTRHGLAIAAGLLIGR
jgi:hypothetical protein